LAEKFWLSTKLEDLSSEQWESLCDGCGLCCLHKLEDEDSGEIFYTDVACKYLDLDNGGCKDYNNRLSNVPECLNLTPEDVKRRGWLPDTCAYKLVSQGRPLYSWHPLISGSNLAMIDQGVAVIRWVVSEEDVEGEDLQDRVIDL